MRICEHLLILVFLYAFPACRILAAESTTPAEKSVSDFSDPAKTYATYIHSIKRNDEATARACHAITDAKDAASVDLAVGLWTSHHRFQKLAAGKFGEHESPYLRDDCTDEALDRTLSRVEKSKFTTTGETAELRIHWDKDDSVEHAVFAFTGDDPIHFRKQDGLWKIKVESPETLEAIAAPGTWGWAFRETTKLLNETSDRIESGEIHTWEQVSRHLEDRTKKLEEQYTQDHDKPSLVK